MRVIYNSLRAKVNAPIREYLVPVKKSKLTGMCQMDAEQEEAWWAEVWRVRGLPDPATVSIDEFLQLVKDKEMKAPSKLSAILENLVAQAQAEPGKKVEYSFGHGATVALYLDAERQFHFRVSRHLVWPGEREWSTFVKHLPERVRPDEYPVHDKKTANAIFAFAAVWPMTLPMFGESARSAE